MTMRERRDAAYAEMLEGRKTLRDQGDAIDGILADPTTKQIERFCDQLRADYAAYTALVAEFRKVYAMWVAEGCPFE